MEQPPRDPSGRIFNRTTGVRWFLIGLVTAIAGLIPLIWGPDEPSTDIASVSMTMAFGVASLSTVSLAMAQRRDPTPAWVGPFWPFIGWLGISAALTWLAIELPVLQRWLLTTSLTGSQWLAVLGLSLLAPLAAELDKAWRRHRATAAPAVATR